MILDDGISVERKYKQQGNMTEARDVLRSILAIDNRHEYTWLLFSMVAESNKDAVYCLSQVLKINLSKQKQQPDQPPSLPSSVRRMWTSPGEIRTCNSGSTTMRCLMNSYMCLYNKHVFWSSFKKGSY
jgi:hypothetical protein